MREEPAARRDAVVATSRVHDWSDRKRAMFRGEHVRVAWEHLKAEGWFAGKRNDL
jgi:hypothetical protein